MKQDQYTSLAEAIICSFNSSNVSDSNGEQANLVDTTQRIAVVLEQVGRHFGTPQPGLGGLEYISMCIKEGLSEIASAISEAK